MNRQYNLLKEELRQAEESRERRFLSGLRMTRLRFFGVSAIQQFFTSVVFESQAHSVANLMHGLSMLASLTRSNVHRFVAYPAEVNGN